MPRELRTAFVAGKEVAAWLGAALSIDISSHGQTGAFMARHTLKAWHRHGWALHEGAPIAVNK
jgi:hypothetical protein